MRATPTRPGRQQSAPRRHCFVLWFCTRIIAPWSPADAGSRSLRLAVCTARARAGCPPELQRESAHFLSMRHGHTSARLAAGGAHGNCHRGQHAPSDGSAIAVAFQVSRVAVLHQIPTDSRARLHLGAVAQTPPFRLAATFHRVQGRQRPSGSAGLEARRVRERTDSVASRGRSLPERVIASARRSTRRAGRGRASR
jgi:hypothetical protein